MQKIRDYLQSHLDANFFFFAPFSCSNSAECIHSPSFSAKKRNKKSLNSRLKALCRQPLIVILVLLFSFCLCAAQKPIIILDPGHGGKDEGAKMKTIIEKKLTLRTAYLTKKELELLGYRVVLTRARDIFLPLQTRAQIANRRPMSLFVSIHYNSAKSPQASGIEVYYYNSKDPSRAIGSKQLASSILTQVVKETSGHSRGVKRGNYHVIRETDMPAALIEAGFLTNFDERTLIKTQTYLEKIAKGIALGIDKHIK